MTDRPRTDHWFEPLAAHMGSAYLRYSFTKGTDREVDAIIELLALRPGDRVLDVGCGPGRHAHALARRGIATHGVDISREFIDVARRDAPDLATFERADARHLDVDGEYDAVICLCQGAFGMMTVDGHDDDVVAGIRRSLREGGRLALTAFHSLFVARHFTDSEFDAATGVNHEFTEIRSESGEVAEVEMWTGCYTARELRLICDRHALQVDAIAGVEPGDYALRQPDIDLPELLVLARAI